MAPFKRMIDAVMLVMGEPDIVFIPRGGESIVARGVFSGTAEEVTPHGTVVIIAHPRLFVDIRPLSRTPQKGDGFRLRGRCYQVTNFVADGEGGGTVDLEIDANAK